MYLHVYSYTYINDTHVNVQMYICVNSVAGVKPGKLVEAHGSFSTASCIICKTKQDPDEVKVELHDVHVVWMCDMLYCVFYISLLISLSLSLSAGRQRSSVGRLQGANTSSVM